MNSEEGNERLLDLEARLLAQDHRLLNVLQTYFVERPKWPPDDPRRPAALKALLWCLFFSPGTVAVAGGTIAIGTLVVLVWQSTLMLQQNEYFREQVSQQQKQIDSQDRVTRQAQRNEAIRVIYGREFSENPRVKAEAIRTLVVLERENIAAGNNVFPSDYVNLHHADLKGIHIENFDLRKVSFQWSDLEDAALPSIDMTESSFRFARMSRAKLFNANLSGTFWDGAQLRDADLSGANIDRANFVRAQLTGADLSGIRNWKTATFNQANVRGVKNAPEGFIEWVLSNGAKNVGDSIPSQAQR